MADVKYIKFGDSGAPRIKVDASLSNEEIKDLLKNRNFWILTAVFSLQFSSMMAILAHLTFYAAERDGRAVERGTRQ